MATISSGGPSLQSAPDLCRGGRLRFRYADTRISKAIYFIRIRTRRVASLFAEKELEACITPYCRQSAEDFNSQAAGASQTSASKETRPTQICRAASPNYPSLYAQSGMNGAPFRPFPVTETVSLF